MYERIEQLCKQNGTSITRICEEITGSKGNLATWKKNNIRPEHLVQIAALFDITIDFLITGQNKNTVSEVRDGIDEPVISKMSESEWKAILYQMNETEIDELLNYARYLRWKHSQVL